MTRACSTLAAAAALIGLGAAAGGAAAAPFSPRVDAAITSERPIPRGGHPALRVTIRQGPGEETMRRSDVILPRQLKPEVLAAANTCAQAQLEADRCPKRSRIGRAVARTPAVEGGLRGPVYLVDTSEPPPGDSGLGLPKIVAKLAGGGLHLDLEGEQRLLATSRLLTTFRGLPPVPVRRFTLRFRSSPIGPLTAARWICARPLDRLDALLVSHEGQRVRRSTRVHRPACKERPRLRASADNLLGAGVPTARIAVKRGRQGRPLRRIKVRLTELLRVPRADPYGVSVRADGRTVPRSRWSLTRHRRLRVATPGGADKVVVRLRGGAIETSRRGRRVFGDDATNRAFFAARMREVGGRTTRVVLPTRVGR